MVAIKKRKRCIFKKKKDNFNFRNSGAGLIRDWPRCQHFPDDMNRPEMDAVTLYGTSHTLQLTVFCKLLRPVFSQRQDVTLLIKKYHISVFTKTVILCLISLLMATSYLLDSTKDKYSMFTISSQINILRRLLYKDHFVIEMDV